MFEKRTVHGDWTNALQYAEGQVYRKKPNIFHRFNPYILIATYWTKQYHLCLMKIDKKMQFSWFWVCTTVFLSMQKLFILFYSSWRMSICTSRKIERFSNGNNQINVNSTKISSAPVRNINLSSNNSWSVQYATENVTEVELNQVETSWTCALGVSNANKNSQFTRCWVRVANP